MNVFFCTKFSRTLRVMDVRARHRGCPHQSALFCGPGDGESLFDPRASGVRIRNVRGNPDRKVYVYAAFSSLI